MRPERSIVVAAALDLTGPGGAVRRTHQLASLLARAGNGVQLVGFGEPGRDRFAGLDPRVAVRTVSDRGTRLARLLQGVVGQIGGVAARRSLRQVISGLMKDGEKPAGVLLYNQDPTLAWDVWKLCRAAGVPFMQQYAEMHIAADYPTRWLHAYYLREQLHLRAMPSRADGNVVISSTLAAMVAQAGARNILVLPALVDREYWEAALTRSGRRWVKGRVLYAGEGARRDCLDQVLKAAALCRARGQPIALRLVGLARRAISQYRELAGSLGIEADVQLEGKLDHARLADEYAGAAASILVRTDDRSSRACFPTRLGEMLLPGRPVILSDIPDYNVAFSHGKNAYLVNPGDVGMIARSLSEAVADNERNSRIGAAGRDVAWSTLSLEAHVTPVSRWLERLA